MRYLLAIIFAILAAGAATIYVSEPIASLIVSRLTFDNPDQVADLHTMLFMGCNLVGLAIGWTIGWWLGGLVSRPEKPI